MCLDPKVCGQQFTTVSSMNFKQLFATIDAVSMSRQFINKASNKNAK